MGKKQIYNASDITRLLGEDKKTDKVESQTSTSNKKIYNASDISRLLGETKPTQTVKATTQPVAQPTVQPTALQQRLASNMLSANNRASMQLKNAMNSSLRQQTYNFDTPSASLKQGASPEDYFDTPSKTIIKAEKPDVDRVKLKEEEINPLATMNFADMTPEDKAELKRQYESLDAGNVAQRLWNQGIRNQIKEQGGKIPEDYPDYTKAYNEKQQLSKNYNLIKSEEAHDKLLANGMTEEELREIYHNVLEQDEIDALFAQGMTEDEVTQYANDLYDRGERARQKLYDLTTELDDKDVSFDDYMNMLREYYDNPAIAEDAKHHPVANSIMSVVTNPVESVAAVGKNVIDYATGTPIRRNDTYTDITRQTVNEQIQNPVGRFFYNTGLSAADSAYAQAAGLAIGGGAGKFVGAGLQGFEKGSQVMNDAVDKDLTPNQIMLQGVSSGLTTFLSELIPMGKLSNIADNGLSKYTAKELAKVIGAQMVTEGAQEGVEDVFDWIADGLVAWDKSDINLSIAKYMAEGDSHDMAVLKTIRDKGLELAQDVLGGALSAPFIGGGTAGYAYAQGKYSSAPSVQTDVVMNSTQAKEALAETVKNIDSTNASEEMAQRIEYAKELANKPVEELSAEDVVDMANVAQEQANETNNIAQSINEINYQANIENNLKQYEQTGTIEKRENELPVERLARERAESIVVEAEKEQQRAFEQKQKQLLEDLKKDAKPVEDFKMTEDIQNSLEEASEGFENDVAAKTFIENYNGSNLALYTEASYLAYRAGESGQNFDKFLQNAFIADLMVKQGGVDKAYLKTLYYNGLNARTNEDSDINLRKNENRGFATGLVEGDKLAEFKKALAKKFNIEVFTDRYDAKMRGDFSANLARLTVNATSDNEYAAIVHEMFEFARAYNPKGMETAEKALVNMIVERTNEAKFVDAVLRYREAYRKAGREAEEGSSLRSEANKSFSEAQEEFINDAISYIFSTDEGMKTLVDYIMSDEKTTQKEKVSAIQAIKDWVDKLITSIKDFISGHKTNNLGYNYAKDANFKTKELESLSRMLTGVLDTAKENLAAMSEENITENAENSEKVAHSVNVPTITKESTEEERYEILKDKNINVASYDKSKLDIDVEKIKAQSKNEAKKAFVALATRLGVIREGYTTPDLDIEFGFSGHSVKKSWNSQNKINVKDRTARFAELITCLPEVIENAQLIEVHDDQKRGEKRGDVALQNVYVLTSAYSDEENIYPVKLLIKDFSDKESKLYVSIVLPQIEKAHITETESGNKSLDRAPNRLFSTYKLADILTFVKNNPDADDLGKYISSQFGNGGGTTKNSLAVDSEGRELTAGQKKYFKDSKIVDENGNLKVMYHGTQTAGFTVFSRADDNISYFFTDNKDVAQTYSGVEYIENPDKPMNFKELSDAAESVTDGSFREEKGKIIFEDYDGTTKTFKSLKDAQNWLVDEYIEPMTSQGMGSPSNYEVYLNATNPYIVNAEGRTWYQLPPLGKGIRHLQNVEIEESKEGTTITYTENGERKSDSSRNYRYVDVFYNKYGIDIDEQTKLFEYDYLHLNDIYLNYRGQRITKLGNTRDIAAYAKENGYDSVIFNDLRDNGGYGAFKNVTSQVVVVFNSNQAKSIYNESPTDNEDIRFSLDVPVNDSEGRKLTKGQQEYFKDSKVRDENGNLLRVYHGSMADFTIFDIGEARESEDIQAFFFSGDKEEASGYGNRRDFYLNITNPADYDTAYDIFFKERKENPSGAGARTREKLIKLGYDGIIANDGDSPQYTEYLAFYPEQIKLVTNTKPTKNEDIRYSIDVSYDAAYKNNDTEAMDKLVREAAVAAGFDSPKLYHGTGKFGFTEFDLSKMDDMSTVFLTSNPEIASTYSGSRKQKNIAERFNKDVDSLTDSELVEALNDNTPDDGTDSKYEYYDEKKIAQLEKKNEESISEIMKLIQEAEKTPGYEGSNAKKNIDEVKTLLYLNSKEQLLHNEEINKRLGARLWFLSQTDTGNILDSSIRERFKEIEEDYRKASTLSKKEDAAIIESSMDGYIYEAYTQDEARKLLSENAGRGIYSLYAKLGKSMIVDGKGKNWNDLSKVWVKGYTSQFNADNTILDREDGRISLYSEEGDLLRDMQENNFTNAMSDEEIKNHLLNGLDYIYGIKRGDIETTRDIVKFAKQHGFDSVIFKNIRDNGGRNSDVDFDETADVYALFNPNKIKSADPITYDDNGEVIPPSERFKEEKSDIRYSLAVDSDGNELTAGQQSFFKNSKMRDAEGRLKVMYHGTERGGFTVFDAEYSDDGLSLFFTADADIARAYSGSKEEYKPLRTVKDMEELIHNSYTDIVKDGDTYKVVYDGKVEFEGNFEALKEYVEEQYGVTKGLNYKVYLNTENPLIVDCEGRNWDELPEIAEGVQTTRDYAAYAYENGYDSVIFNDIYDSGVHASGKTKYKNTQVVVVFDSNQVKSVYNENPTEDSDIRHSIDVDAFMDAFEAVDNDVKLNENELHDLIKNRMDLESDVSKKMISEVASNIKKLYNSGIDKKTLERDLTTVFRYLKNTARYSMEDVMTVMTDIAKPILENVKAASPEQEKLYKDFTDFVKGYTIALNNEQMQEVRNEFGSYTNFKRMMAGKMKLDKNGTMLDDVWTEISDRSNGKLSFGTNPNDQPVELARYIMSLNPTYQNLQGQSPDAAATDLALEIFRQFYVQQSMTDAAVKVKDEMSRRSQAMKERYQGVYNAAVKQVEYEKALNMKRLAEEIDNLTAEEQEAIRNGDTVNQALIQNIKNEYQKRYDRLQAESVEKIAKAKANYQNAYINKNLRRERSELKNRLLREVKALQNIIAHPQEGATKHVPINLIKPTIEMLEAINLDNGGANKTIVERLKKMSEVYESFKNNEAYSFDYDERIAHNIEELQQMFENKSYADLSITELERVIEIVTALKTQIKNANNLILQGKLKDAKEAADSAITDVQHSRRNDNAAMNLLNRYGNMHLNAYREFRKLEGYVNGSLMDIYRDLDEGSKREMQIQKDLGEIFADVLEGKENQKEIKKFISTKKEDLVDLGITDKEGKPILVTRAMRMSLIMHSMNAGNMRHILGSGITVPNMYYFEKGKLDEAYAKGTNYRFVDYAELLNAIQKNDTNKVNELTTAAQKRIEEMKKDLSPWEQRFLADAEEMFHEETGKIINDTSLKLKGYALARVKNYFPIRTDSHFTQKEWSGLVKDGSLEGSGFLKERVISTKPILLEDITNVVQRQIGSVSKYGGFAIPVRNFETIMKQTKRLDNGELQNLYQVIDNTWGASDSNWLRNMMQDIQGGRGEKGSPLMRLRGQFAGATLSLNPSVAIKQAASYPTAAAVLGWKPLGRALTDVGKGFGGKGIEELEKINPLLWYRSQGYGTQELADAKAVGFGKNLPPKLQKAINWTQWFDTGTVRTLEYASMYYVDENFKNLEKGSTEYWQKVSDTFTKVVEETQPNYSTLHKADIIRNPNSFVKMLVMFKTQPMQNFGIIYDAMGELNAAKISGNKKWINEASEKAAHAISSQVVSASVFSAMTILSQLLLHRWWKYRDDEGEWDWKKLLVAFGEGVISCMTGAFIGGSELYEALKHIFTGESYYGIEISVAEMVNDFVENMGNLTKNTKALVEANTTEDKEKATQKLVKAGINLGATVGEFEGTPVNNIKNMLSAMYFYTMDAVRSIDEGELSISDDSKIENWDIPTQYERIYDAMQSGDDKKYQKLVDELVKDAMAGDENLSKEDAAAKVEEKVTQKILNMMKEGYLEGEISPEEMQNFLVEEKGKTEDEAYFQMRQWETGESTYGVLKDSINKAAENPTPENRKAMIDEVNNLLAHGKDKSAIASQLTSNYKAQYIELYNQGKAADLNAMLRAALVAAGYTDEEAKKKLDGWIK